MNCRLNTIRHHYEIGKAPECPHCHAVDSEGMWKPWSHSRTDCAGGIVKFWMSIPSTKSSETWCADNTRPIKVLAKGGSRILLWRGCAVFWLALKTQTKEPVVRSTVHMSQQGTWFQAERPSSSIEGFSKFLSPGQFLCCLKKNSNGWRIMLQARGKSASGCAGYFTSVHRPRSSADSAPGLSSWMSGGNPLCGGHCGSVNIHQPPYQIEAHFYCPDPRIKHGPCQIQINLFHDLTEFNGIKKFSVSRKGFAILILVFIWTLATQSTSALVPMRGTFGHSPQQNSPR